MNTQIQNPKRFYENKWFQALAVIAVLAAGLIGSQALIATAPKAEKRPAPKKARLVQDMGIQSQNAQVSLTGYGIVQAEQQVVLQAQVAGRVQKLSPQFIPGQRVKKGQVLVELDPTDYQLELANAKANLAQAQAALAQEQGNQAVAQADFELLQLNVSQREKDLILRKPQLESAKAAVTSAKAAAERANVNLARTKIRAPFNGIVVSRQTAVGAQAGPGVQLGQLASADTFWINVAIPQENLKWVEFPDKGKAGSTVCVSDASARVNQDCHPGKVLNLQGFVQDNGRQAQVLVEVRNKAGANTNPLLIAQYVKVRFEGRTLNDVFVLDPSHVHDDVVWLNVDGELKVTPVEIAFRSSDQVMVQSGLSNGQRLITSNLSAAIDGMAIRTDLDEANKP